MSLRRCNPSQSLFEAISCLFAAKHHNAEIINEMLTLLTITLWLQAPTTLRRCVCSCMPTAASVASTSLTSCTQKRSCHQSSSFSCRCRRTIDAGMRNCMLRKNALCATYMRWYKRGSLHAQELETEQRALSNKEHACSCGGELQERLCWR